MRGCVFGGLAALAAALVPVAGAKAADAPVVKVDAGALQGVAADGVASFKGVPFAKPPVGMWRWRPPQRPDGWNGVRPATAYGAICMQPTVPGDNGVGSGPVSEDCLTLNVFTPRTDPSAHAAPLPVMVWIHGGGLVNGSGTAALYDGTHLAQQGVVVVTINYRLGRFGFFAHPALTAETPKTYLGNYGLMDQIAALQWVKRNIAVFGGDPGNVTIFGESAGGYSVDRLMLIRQARGLFHKAISQSGAYKDPNLTLAAAEQEGVAFARRMGVAGDDPAALRALPAAAIVAADDLSEASDWGAPILDGRLLTEDARSGFGRGRSARVPYLIGSNSLELHLDPESPRFAKLIKQTPDEIAALVTAYGSQAAFDLHAPTDVAFAEPARALARDHAISGSPTYLYRFAVLSAGAPASLKGAPHASDRQYVFDTLKASPWPTDERDETLAKTISAYWVAFARTGDPNGDGRPHWPAYNSRDQLMDFTNDGPIAKATSDAPVLDLIAERYRQTPSPR
jgi:para-nitrobenzyl esterase